MRTILLIMSVLSGFVVQGQTIIWSENFGADVAPCTSQGTLANGYNSGNGAWTTTNTGANDADANRWFVSTMEEGVGAGNCGTGCGAIPAGPGTDRTLHLSNAAFPLLGLAADQGAAYNAGGLCTFLSFCVLTDVRVESPNINLSGSNMTLTFDYIHLGDANDRCEFLIFDGSTWVSQGILPNTTACGSGQHQWATFTWPVPAILNGITNFRVGYRWTNNDDGAGTDPSVAIDNILITEPSTAPPVAAFTATPNPVCVGQTVTVTFTGSAVAGATYAWDFGTGATPATANTAGPHSVTYNTAGTSTITLTVTDANGTDNTSQSITINALPTVTASAAPSISVCDGDQVTLSGSGATTYTWSGGVSNGVAFTPPLGSNPYTVTGTDANGCSNAANITVTVNNCAQPVAAFTASSTNICVGQTITFTDNSTGTNISSWNWTFNSGAPGTANTQGPHSITFNTIGTHTIALSIIDDNGSNSTSQTITVNPLPTVTGSASASTICNGDPVTLTGSGATTYTWNGGVTNGVPFTPSASGTYTVTGTDGNGCQNTASVSITVNNCLPPTAAFTFPNPICEGQCIAFTDQSTDATSWLWTFAGAIPATSTSQNPSNICFAAAGSYVISLEVSNSQGSDVFTQTIVVEAQPTLTVTPDVTIAAGSSTTLNATTGISGTYTWSPSTSLSSTAGPTVTASPESTTTYIVLFESTSGCTATEQITVNVELIEAFGIPSAFSPNGDGFNDVFRPRGSGVQNFTMQIFNRYGQLVFETTDFLIGWDGTMNGNKLNPGVFAYIITYNFYGKDSQTLKGNVTLVE